MSPIGWDVAQQAEQVARRLTTGSYVNLGIGMPTAVAAEIQPEQQIVLHCENGLIGYRDKPSGEVGDPNVIDAGSRPMSLIAGAAVVGHDLSFAIARGGRLDATVLGAYQVSEKGDLASWKTPKARLAGVGGAMDLAVGAKRVIVMMRHVDRDGGPKIVPSCTYPLTAPRCVDLIVTNLAVLDVRPHGLVVQALAPGVTHEEVQAVTDVTLHKASQPAM